MLPCGLCSWQLSPVPEERPAWTVLVPAGRLQASWLQGHAGRHGQAQPCPRGITSGGRVLSGAMVRGVGTTGANGGRGRGGRVNSGAGFLKRCVNMPGVRRLVRVKVRGQFLLWKIMTPGVDREHSVSQPQVLCSMSQHSTPCPFILVLR
ncbi:hypothetical protein NDU88_003223 [Pleurodeles waltl]|uniref:Uncharacterized protein n=1 Tax=Pleurodeles waltl TaxID=8319 RepID=A0AAV7SF81_PLEWA|nr:hypothetical protein NDU88_003223 [Pleurodeles waltl]